MGWPPIAQERTQWTQRGAAIGFGVGAVAGAVIAGSAYNSGYYGYYGEPGYA
ncbi:MAG: hypothetical protein WCF53_23250 [Pseudolabrys sp.]